MRRITSYSDVSAFPTSNLSRVDEKDTVALTSHFQERFHSLRMGSPGSAPSFLPLSNSSSAVVAATASTSPKGGSTHTSTSHQERTPSQRHRDKVTSLSRLATHYSSQNLKAQAAQAAKADILPVSSYKVVDRLPPMPIYAGGGSIIGGDGRGTSCHHKIVTPPSTPLTTESFTAAAAAASLTSNDKGTHESNSNSEISRQHSPQAQTQANNAPAVASLVLSSSNKTGNSKVDSGSQGVPVVVVGHPQPLPYGHDPYHDPQHIQQLAQNSLHHIHSVQPDDIHQTKVPEAQYWNYHQHLSPSNEPLSGHQVEDLDQLINHMGPYRENTLQLSVPLPTERIKVDHVSNDSISQLQPRFSATDITTLDGFASQSSQRLSHQSNLDLRSSHEDLITQWVLVMVGLPARGKTHLALSLRKYLNWLGYNTKVFNISNYRRHNYGADQDAEFFNPDNHEGLSIRAHCAKDCIEDLIIWLKESKKNVIAIYDGTNTTRERRAWVSDTLSASSFKMLFLEAICDDDDTILHNIDMLRLWSPDYKDKDPEYAKMDFERRLKHYESIYEPLDGSEPISFIKVKNSGKQIFVNNISGYLPGKILSYVLNTHTYSRTIYLSRHGESKWNVTGQLGGNPDLTERGKRYAKKLAEFLKEEFTDRGLDLPAIWTSQLQRTRQTVDEIPTIYMAWRALNEIDSGICDGLTYAKVKEIYPDVHEGRKKDKLRYRYPGGESYVDVIHRLEPVILELERQDRPVLVVAHNAIIRAIYSFYMAIPQEECPNLDIPLNTVFKITTRAYGCDVFKKEFDVD